MRMNKRWGNGARVDDLDTGKKILLNAAAECFAHKGIKATTIEDIACSANVTRRTVYRYFNGKADIIAALTDLERSRMFDKLAEHVAPLYNDFPTLLQESICFAASYQPDEIDGQRRDPGRNAVEPTPYVEDHISDDHWRQILEGPLLHYNQSHHRQIDLLPLIAVASRLAMSFRQYPIPREQMIASLKALTL